MIVVALAAVLAAVAVPAVAAGMKRYVVISASQQVAGAIRAARFQAVAKNRALRVRFNCPEDGQYRVVEVVNDAAIDDDEARCETGDYPYPAPDSDPDTVPNADGPVQYLPDGAEFGDADDLEIDTSGRVTPQTGCPNCADGVAPGTIVVSNGDEDQDRTITVSASGRVQLP